MGDMSLTQHEILQMALVDCGRDMVPANPEKGLYYLLSTFSAVSIAKILSEKLTEQGYRVSKDFSTEK